MKTLSIPATLALLTAFVQAVPINSPAQFQLVVIIDEGVPTNPAPLADIKITFSGARPANRSTRLSRLPMVKTKLVCHLSPFKPYPPLRQFMAEGSSALYPSQKLEELIII